MTAAPGPQQPDEVRCFCGQPESEHGWAGRLGCDRYRPANEADAREFYRSKLRGILDRRLAAPSAQPDDPLDPEDRDWVQTFVDALPGVSVVHVFTAQPVRDTEEGRR